MRGKFEWQRGFGAFTVSQSGVTNMMEYIKNQKQHHTQKTFREEYIEFLKAYEIDFDDKYVFTNN